MSALALRPAHQPTAVEWVLRHAGGCLLDTPDIPINEPAPPGVPWRWIATVWPDRYQPDGWNALEWHQGERGWQLPDTLAVGDIIEVGLSWLHPHRPDLDRTYRWYGWLAYATPLALVVNGPYPHPAHAVRAAQHVVDEVRLAQLVEPACLPPPRTS